MTPSPAFRELWFALAAWREDTRTDGELLRRFAAHRDEDAFRTLVGRHGRLVWGVCQRVLGNAADAEDAVQATFLRLARDAGRIARTDTLAGWLFAAARCAALDLRRTIRRRRRLADPPRLLKGATDLTPAGLGAVGVGGGRVVLTAATGSGLKAFKWSGDKLESVAERTDKRPHDFRGPVAVSGDGRRTACGCGTVAGLPKGVSPL